MQGIWSFLKTRMAIDLISFTPIVDVSYSFRGEILVHAPLGLSIMIPTDDRRNIRVSRRYVVYIYV